MASNIEHGCFIRTTNKPNYFRAIWTIEHILDYPAKIGSYLRSPPFICTKGTDYRVEFYLKIFPRGVTEESREFVGAFLFVDKLPEDVKDMKVSFDVSLIDARNKQAHTLRTEASQHLLFTDMKRGLGWHKFTSRKDLRKNAHAWLPYGHLTLECNVTTHFILKNPVSTVRIQSEKAELVKMVNKENICRDVRMKASNGRVIDAHHFILSIRSPYFKSMFQLHLKENEEGFVELSRDMTGREVEVLLSYIFLRTPPVNLGDTACKMSQIGDMKRIQGLKQLSERTLIAQRTDDNAPDQLIFANQLPISANETRNPVALLSIILFILGLCLCLVANKV